MKVIACTGFGNTGSSAATDFFSEFSNVHVVSHLFECTFLHEADGLYDLEMAVAEGHRLKVDLAVKRFLKLAYSLQSSEYRDYFDGKFLEFTLDFVSNTIGFHWDGWWHRAFEENPLTRKQKLIKDYLNAKLKTQISEYGLYETDSWTPSYLPCIDECYECDINHFREEAKKYVSRLLETENTDGKEYLAIDQLLPPISAEKYIHYFDDIKIVVIDRDPRDLYLCNNLFWGSRYLPTFDIDTYIKWFKKTRELVSNTENVMVLKFEDFIYNYEKNEDKLLEFTGLEKCNHVSRYTVLQPEKSMKNTRLFEIYDNYAGEVDLISQNLGKYLYNYSLVSIPENSRSNEKKKVIPIKDLILDCDAEFKRNKFDIHVIFFVIKKSLYTLLLLPYKVVRHIWHVIH